MAFALLSFALLYSTNVRVAVEVDGLLFPLLLYYFTSTYSSTKYSTNVRVAVEVDGLLRRRLHRTVLEACSSKAVKQSLQ